MNEMLHSGDIAPRSGTYNVLDAQGRVLGSVSVRKGDTLPPTQTSGSHFEYCCRC